MTYREEAIRRIMGTGINKYEAEVIVDLMEKQGCFAPQVFNDFKEDPDDNWDNELKLKEKSDVNNVNCKLLCIKGDWTYVYGEEYEVKESNLLSFHCQRAVLDYGDLDKSIDALNSSCEAQFRIIKGDIRHEWIQ